MTSIQRRFKAVIERLGDEVSLPAGVRKALAAPLKVADAATYLTEAERTTAPVWALYVPFDDPTATTDSVTYLGDILTVKRVVELRFQGSTAVRMLVCG